MSIKSCFLSAMLFSFSQLSAAPTFARDFTLQMVYAKDAPAGKNSLERLQRELNQFFSQHPTSACRDINVKIKSRVRDPAINPNGVDIRSSATFFALRAQAEALGGNVLVVRSLSYCGAIDSDYAGCAEPGSVLVVESNDGWAAKVFIALILHEFGHGQKLAEAVHPKGNAHSDSAQDLMYPSVTGDNNLLSTQECGFIKAENARFQSVLQGAAVNQADQVQDGLSLEIDDVPFSETEDEQDATEVAISVPASPSEPYTIVTTPWIAGTPYEVLDAIEDKEGLLNFARGLLVSREEQAYWGNAAKVLGAYGIQNDINLLFFLLSHPTEGAPLDGSASLTDIKVAAIESLGYLAGRHNDRNALRRLEEIKAQLTLTALSSEGRMSLSTVDILNEQLAGAVVLDPSSPYSVGDALSAAITALAEAEAAINPETADATSAARVRIESSSDGIVSLPGSGNTPLTAARVLGRSGIPDSDGFIDLPQSIDPNLVGELNQKIDQIKNAPSFDVYLRQ